MLSTIGLSLRKLASNRELGRKAKDKVKEFKDFSVVTLAEKSIHLVNLKPQSTTVIVMAIIQFA